MQVIPLLDGILPAIAGNCSTDDGYPSLLSKARCQRGYRLHHYYLYYE